MINSQVSQYANSSPKERKQHPTIAAKADVGFKGIWGPFDEAKFKGRRFNALKLKFNMQVLINRTTKPYLLFSNS